jgi:hypothetical protein
MRLQRIRCLLVFVLALFMVNSVAAAARACTLTQVRHEHSTIQLLQASVERACPEATATLCGTHCLQEAKSAEVKAPVDSPAALIAPLFTFIHSTVRPEPAHLPVAIAQVIVGPSLTILFGNLRI